jgi:hypothetical protein
VFLDYCDNAPFKFNGTIEKVYVEYKAIAKAGSEHK